MSVLIEFIGQLDISLFLIINQELHTQFLDPVMLFLSKPGKGMLLLIGMWLILLTVCGKKGRITAILIAVSLSLTDPVAARILKPTISRARPNHPDFVIENGRYIDGYNGSKSYPSAHASNAFGVAGIFACFYPMVSIFWFVLAGAIGYSRIYLGQHFPLDVLGGCLVGLLVSGCIFQCFVAIKNLLERIKCTKKPK